MYYLDILKYSMTLFCNMLAPIIAHLNNSTKELQQLQGGEQIF